MQARYEDVSAPRFRVAVADGVEQIDIPPRRSAWGLFLVFWLCGWTVGGFSAAAQLFSGRGAEPFMVFWLCGWIFGEALVAMALAWMIAGVERLRIVGSDLEVSYHLLGLSKTSLYRGSDVQNLAACTPMVFGRNYQLALLF